MTSIYAAPLLSSTLLSVGRIPIDTSPTSSPAHTTPSQLHTYIVGGVINALDHGVVADGLELADVSVTNASNVINSVAYQFTAADVGKAITIRNAATTTTAISGFIGSTSSGSASLVTTQGGSTALNAGRTVSNLSAVFGTPNQTALANAGAAAAAKAAYTSLPCVVDMPTGIIVITDGIGATSLVSWRGKGMRATVLKYLTPNMGAAVFNGLSGLYIDTRYEDFGIDQDDVILASYAVTKKAFYIQNMLRGVFRRLWLSGSPASCIGVDFLVDTFIQDNVIIDPGRLNTGQSGGAGVGIGVTDATVPQTNRYESIVCTGNQVYNSRKHAIFFETQSATLRAAGEYLIANNIVHMGPSAYSGIGDNGCTGLMIANNKITGEGAGSGISIRGGVSGSSPVGAEGLITANVIRNTAIGIEGSFADGGGPATSARYSINDNKITGCTSPEGAVVIRTSATVGNPLSNMCLKDNEIYNCAGPAIAFVGTAPMKNVSISNLSAYNNGTAGSGIRSAVYVGVPIAGFRLSDCDLYDDKGSPTQTYGLEVAAGVAITDAIVSDNRFAGNLTGAVGLNSTGTITGTTSGNQGWAG
ncbi:hypothetical protein [Sphingobium sp. BS19]|uniref:hypothetical protein n=1 Tax=Sphingobium sp. BS19 TaxID=3018973 RepID=UPI0022EDD317|nr:hypothetical protein [Sphingobium sp. BS19]GLI99128.1 hypothetical protein Sbs19_29460 [Sphingobium sp. BS19]